MQADTYFAVLEIRPRGLHMLTKCSTNELYTQPVFLILKLDLANAETGR